ncbi:class I SAM-dependent methyltransferase [Rhodococcoides corynebacterioides]|uniref:class I SAM-dependent methyltransferase n=2 Tax=Rhodococcoides corynebacterioides TaxID=53972 RepID=UPI0009EDE97C|nr:class I SAM-dependent methyltransferase [Rhodococcus corynebacterioides]
MPMSSTEGKSWTRDRVFALAEEGPVSVLDIGPGVGTYAKLLAGPHVDRLTGIEIWQPYVDTYRLHEYYDEIVVGDARKVDLPDADVVIIGDVAEHMTEADALTLWERCTAAARKAVYLSIPIVHYPQHEIEGNPHEIHVDEDWNHERVLASFAGIGAYELGGEVGVYERRV